MRVKGTRFVDSSKLVTQVIERGVPGELSDGVDKAAVIPALLNVTDWTAAAGA